jgi:hypothetical protein
LFSGIAAAEETAARALSRFGVRGAAMLAEPAVAKIDEVVGFVHKSQRTEVRNQRTEVRGQSSEVRNQKLEARSQGKAKFLIADF